jgi:hypothetical protein
MALIAWLGRKGFVVPRNGFIWVNSCLLYVFTGAFGVQGQALNKYSQMDAVFTLVAIDHVLTTIDPENDIVS